MGVRERRRCWGLWALRPLLLSFRPRPWPCRTPAQPHASRPCFLSTSLHVSLPWFSVPDSLLPSCRCLRASPWTSSPAPSSLGWWPFGPGWARPTSPARPEFPGRPGLVSAPHLPTGSRSWSPAPPSFHHQPRPSLLGPRFTLTSHLSGTLLPATMPSAPPPPILYSHSHTRSSPPPTPIDQGEAREAWGDPQVPPKWGPATAPCRCLALEMAEAAAARLPAPSRHLVPPQCCHGNQDRTERGREREHERSDRRAGLRVPGRQAGTDRRRQTGPETPEAGGCQVPKGGICFWSPRWGRDGTPWTLCFQWPGPG